jgi:hypothetical protein
MSKNFRAKLPDPQENREEGKGKGRGEDGEGRNWSPPLFRSKLRPCRQAYVK